MSRILKVILPLIGKVNLMKYVFLSILSGLLSFLFINTVTRMISMLMEGGIKMSDIFVLIFCFIILLFAWCWRSLSVGLIHYSQELFWKLRKQIISAVLESDYRDLVRNRMEVNSAIVSDVNVLTNASLNIITFFTSSVVATACLIYLLSISWKLFLISMGTVLFGVTAYRIASVRNMRHFDAARENENSFLASFNAILDGFKEIFMDPGKGQAIYNDRISPISDATKKLNERAFIGFLHIQITGQILFYLLISSVLLFFAKYFSISNKDTVAFVFTLLYTLTSVETIMVLLPGIMRARVASRHLLDLISGLPAKSSDHGVTGNIEKDKFRKISLRSVTYAYGDEGKTSFKVGPNDFEIGRGEVVFVYGSNGSGKTTFVSTFLGLYKPASGDIFFNDLPVTAGDYKAYRSLFGVVFSNFYLFDHLYGLETIDGQKWKLYTEMFEVEEKVSLSGSAFSTTDLSLGQRKRLALISVLLEEKPVLVLDEWAADQDPYFRRKFYTEIIPYLKAQGVTILAVTHDDKYYQYADRIYKMEDGHLAEVTVKSYESNLIL